ncbi:HIRAN domain-containing protein [Microbulbifer sp. S227A]|uniref:HIRAN domain-containing protein n=1 Tax=Microbulbifer sp. S227A TaxID=3415131 RepID=UPI003C7EC6D3
MKPFEKFVFRANRPNGNWINWRIGSGWFAVAGIDNRIDDVIAFLKAAASASDENRLFGIRLVPEPHNPNDENAIKVMGIAAAKRGELKTWHIGYVPRQIAENVAAFYDPRVIAAELKQAKIGDHKIYVSIAGLIAKGTIERTS